MLIEACDWERFGSFPPPLPSPPLPSSHVWRLGFDSPLTGYFFSMFLPLGLRSSRTPFLKFGYGLRHTMVLCYIAPIPFRTTLIISDLRPSLSNILITFCSCSDLEFTKNFTRTFSSATNLVSLGIPTHPPPPPAKELCIYPTCLRLTSGYSSTDLLDACSVTSYRLSSTSFTLCAVCASTVCWMYFAKLITSLQNKQSNTDQG